jgi:hypothetical protein
VNQAIISHITIYRDKSLVKIDTGGIRVVGLGPTRSVAKRRSMGRYTRLLRQPAVEYGPIPRIMCRRRRLESTLYCVSVPHRTVQPLILWLWLDWKPIMECLRWGMETHAASFSYRHWSSKSYQCRILHHQRLPLCHSFFFAPLVSPRTVWSITKRWKNMPH